MIIFLYGPDTFRSRQKLAELKDKFLREVDPSGINIHVLDGSSAPIEEIEKNLLSPSFLARKRMVVIEKFLSKNQPEVNTERIISILQKKTIKDTIVIIWEEELDEKKLKNNLLCQFLLKQTYKYLFDLLGPAQAQKWIKQEIKKGGGEIHPTAAIYLSDIVGSDLWLANTEISKLLSYSNGKEITLQDIKTLCHSKTEENIFLLTDALGHKNTALATKLIHDQLQAETTFAELLHRCLWQFKNLLMIKDFIDTEKDTNYYSIAKKINLHPFIVKKSVQQTKNFTTDELKGVYKKLTDIDYKIKTNQINAEVLFDLLVMK